MSCYVERLGYLLFTFMWLLSTKTYGNERHIKTESYLIGSNSHIVNEEYKTFKIVYPNREKRVQ